MKCDRNLINKFLDGEISSNRKSRVKEHIENCAQCCRYYNEIAKITSVLRDAGKPNPPAGVFLRVKRNITPHKAFLLRARFALTAGAVLTLFLAVTGVFSPNGANAELDYYIESQLDALFGEGLRSELTVYEQNWQTQIEILLEEGEL